MTLGWFFAIVITLSVIFLIVMVLFSKVIIEGVAAFLARVVNKSEYKKRERRL